MGYTVRQKRTLKYLSQRGAPCNAEELLLTHCSAILPDSIWFLNDYMILEIEPRPTTCKVCVQLTEPGKLVQWTEQMLCMAGEPFLIVNWYD